MQCATKKIKREQYDHDMQYRAASECTAPEPICDRLRGWEGWPGSLCLFRIESSATPILLENEYFITANQKTVALPPQPGKSYHTLHS